MATSPWQSLMKQALVEANKATAGESDVPVGAILVDPAGNIVATGSNNKEATFDPTGHAEIVAIRKATELRQDWRLEDLTLVVTLEPCVLCGCHRGGPDSKGGFRRLGRASLRSWIAIRHSSRFATGKAGRGHRGSVGRGMLGTAP